MSKAKYYEFKRGSKKIKVEGTEYSRADRFGDDVLVSITPRCGYQDEHNWPPKGNINVNWARSRSTSSKNFLGYIPKRHTRKFKKALSKLGKKYDYILVHAEIRSDKTAYLHVRRFF